jgi:hypothetical protein
MRDQKFAYKFLDYRDTVTGFLRFNKPYCLQNSKEIAKLITEGHRMGVFTSSRSTPYYLIKEYDVYYETSYLFDK